MILHAGTVLSPWWELPAGMLIAQLGLGPHFGRVDLTIKQQKGTQITAYEALILWFSICSFLRKEQECPHIYMFCAINFLRINTTLILHAYLSLYESQLGGSNFDDMI